MKVSHPGIDPPAPNKPSEDDSTMRDHDPEPLKSPLNSLPTDTV